MSMKHNAFYAIVLTGAALFAMPAQAATMASSSAYGAKANVGILGNSVAVLAEVAPVSGSAPAPYDNSNTVLGVNQNFTLVNGVLVDVVQHIGTGIITTSASSAYPGALTATSSAQIAGLSFGLNTQLTFPPITLASIGIAADVISSTTTVGAGPGGLWGAGSSTLAGLDLTGSLLGALDIDVGALVNAAPNTLIDLGAISLLFNEQGEILDGDSGIFRFTNAIHISLSDFLFDGNLLNGDIILGHSQASITGYEPTVTPPTSPVPEPASWAMMILGFGVVGLMARRRRDMPVPAIA